VPRCRVRPRRLRSRSSKTPSSGAWQLTRRWSPACTKTSVGRWLRPERVAAYTAAVAVYSTQAKALKDLHGDAFAEACEQANVAEIACKRAYEALWNDSGEAEP
jgi:hypothetical protein